VQPDLPEAVRGLLAWGGHANPSDEASKILLTATEHDITDQIETVVPAAAA
jgi:hypothetical protein